MLAKLNSESPSLVEVVTIMQVFNILACVFENLLKNISWIKLIG